MGRACGAAKMQCPSQFDPKTSTEDSPEDGQEFFLLPHDGTSTSSLKRSGRLDRFFKSMKTHISDALPGVCKKIDVVESAAKEWDIAQMSTLLLLQRTLRENESNQQVRNEAMMQQIDHLREQTQLYHEEYMRHFSQYHPSIGKL